MSSADEKRPVINPEMGTPELRVFLGKFYCGCGSPEAATEALLWILDTFGTPYESPDRKAMYQELPKKVQDEGMQFLLLYFIDHLGLLEHGSGIMHSWLTDEGNRLRDALKRESTDKFEKLHETACIHGYAVEGPEAEGHDCSKMYVEEAGLVDCIVCGEPAKFMEPRCRTHQNGQTRLDKHAGHLLITREAVLREAVLREAMCVIAEDETLALLTEKWAQNKRAIRLLERLLETRAEDQATLKPREDRNG